MVDRGGPFGTGAKDSRPDPDRSGDWAAWRTTDAEAGAHGCRSPARGPGPAATHGPKGAPQIGLLGT
eukprot:4994897-Alexandrium_andersonii.AAC.1